jgi:diguanylate cyclase (GGDEF)-like protein
MLPSTQGQDIRRLIMAPLLTLAMACTLLLLAHAGIKVPVPGAFLLTAIVLATYFGGALAGYLSAAAGLAMHPLLLSEPALVFMPDRPSRLAAVAVLALIVPVLTVYARNRIARRLANERTMRERAEAANRELLLLRAELMRHAQELERLATTDDLTGLCNRRHFLALAEDARRHHAFEGRPLSLMIFDIDLFKSINDRFGHDTGDAVIRHVADICRGEVSGSEILARVGGEEFVLLLPETTGERAMVRAEAMRQRLETTSFELQGAKVRVTVSIGVSEAAAANEDIGDLMKRADQALYQAKRDGRNRVRRARPAASSSGNGIAAASVAA